MTITREDDKRMMLTPDDWPCWPVLPVKRNKDGESECAVLIDRLDRDVVTRVVYNVAMWDVFAAIGTGDGLKKIPRTEYADVDAILDDGWVVD